MSDFIFSPVRLHELEQLIEKSVQRAVAGMPQSAQVKPEDELLNAEEAAAYLGIAMPTLYGLVSASKLSSMKPGGKLYFSKADLNVYIKSARRRSKAEMAAHIDDNLTAVA